MRMKSSTGGGEIIQVQGGHIVRSTGRKDRHSKVYTAKGPRDRRVRLSAHTAIQFYDVQDRLGYDRPSKAVDWLINKAQSAIEKLVHQPPWLPTAGAADASVPADMALPKQSESPGYNFVPQSLDPDAMKSFFPASSSVSSTINFQSYPPEIIPRTTNEDLCLSLHSFQDQTDHHFAGGGGSSSVSFDPSFQRMVSWESEQEENRVGGGGGGGGFMFGSLLISSPREPLQSSFAAQPSVRAWDYIPLASAGDRGRFGSPEFFPPTSIHGQDEPSSSPSSRH